MIHTSGGRVLTVNGKPIFFEDNSLAFEVRGSQFPNYGVQNSQNGMIFRSFTPQRVTVNWGDGQVGSYALKPLGALYTISWPHDGGTNSVPLANQMPKHIYQDGDTGRRIITFTFEELDQLQSLEVRYVYIEGNFPFNISSAKRLEALTLTNVGFLESFPQQLATLRSLRHIILLNISPLRFAKIPDAFFDLDLTSFAASTVFNLSDRISSNLFKINQWSRLEVLGLGSSMITEVDETLRELIHVTFLDLSSNNFSEFPPELAYITKLTTLRIGFGNILNIPMMDFSNHNSIEALQITTSGSGSFLLQDVPTQWVGLTSLNRVESFNNFTRTNAKFNEFIHVFYELCTTNGSMLPYGAAAPYPNRFRNISWGHGSRAIDTPKVAPDGYEQGVSNGNAITAGEKAFVLQHQYNHTITHA